jgi:oligoendopeptidase F
LLHEFGHAYHDSLLDEMLYPHRADLQFEFCEFAGEAMNFLTLDHLHHGIGEALAAELKRRNLRLYLNSTEDAAYGAFQMWLYLHPEHSLPDRREALEAIADRFGQQIDCSPFDWPGDLGSMFPLVGCLGFWRNLRRDRGEAVRRYKHALSLGATVPTPKLFEAAGVPFEFSPDALAPIFAELRLESILFTSAETPL